MAEQFTRLPWAPQDDEDLAAPYLRRRQQRHVTITTDVAEAGRKTAAASQRQAKEAEHGPATPLEQALGRTPTPQEQEQFESLARGEARAATRRAAEQAREDEARAAAAPSPAISAAGTTTPTAETLREPKLTKPLAARTPELAQQAQARFVKKLSETAAALERLGLPKGAAVPLTLVQAPSEALGAAVFTAAREAGVDPHSAEGLDLLSSLSSSLLTLHPQIGMVPVLGSMVGQLAKGGASAAKVVRSLALHEEATRNIESFQHFLQRGEWAILSAEKADMTEPQKAFASAQLFADLIERGYRPIPAKGVYGGAQERSFLVPGMKVDEALELGKKYSQESVLIPEGLLDTNTRVIKPADLSRIDFSPGPEAEAFTELEVGGAPTRFAVPIDFERTLVPLEHYSPRGDLDILDPAFFGTAHAGRERRRAALPDFLPRTYYYEGGTKPEAALASEPFRYTAWVDEKAIYDLGTDPQGFLAKAGGDPTTAERLIREAGYVGYKNSASSIPNAVAVFEALRPLAKQENTVVKLSVEDVAGPLPSKLVTRLLLPLSLAGGLGAAAAEDPDIAAAGIGGIPLTFAINWKTFSPHRRAGNAVASVLAARVAMQHKVLGGGKKEAREWLVKTFGPEIEPFFEPLWAKARELYEKDLRAIKFRKLDEVLRFHAEGSAFPDWYGAGTELAEIVGAEHAERAAGIIAALSAHTPVARMNENFVRLWTAERFDEVTDLESLSRLVKEVAPDIPATQLPNVLRALRGEELVGNKVWAFKHNLLGRREIAGRPVVTIDGQTAGILFEDIPRKPSGEVRLLDSHYAFAQEYITHLSRVLGDPDPVYTQQAKWIGRKVVEGLRTDERIETMWEGLKRTFEEQGVIGFFERAARAGMSEAGMRTVALSALIGGAMLSAWRDSNTTADFEQRFGDALVAIGLAGMLPPPIGRKAAKVMQDAAGALRAARGAAPAAVIRPATEAERRVFVEGLRATDKILRGDDVVQINWATLREPGALDEVFRLLVKARPVEPSETVPDQVVKELADELGMTVDDFLRRNPTATFSAAEAAAAKDLLVAGREQLLDLARRLETAPNDAELQAAFDYHFGTMALLHERFLNIASEMGRAFRVLRAIPGDLPAVLREQVTPETRQQVLRRLLSQPAQLGLDYTKQLTPEELQQVRAMLLTLQPHEQAGFLRRVFSAAGTRALYEAWINTLLFTFQGHTANFLSNAVMLSREIANVQAAGILGLFRDGPDRVLLGEASAMFLGALHGYIDALLAGGRVGAVARVSAGAMLGAAAGAATDQPIEGAIAGAAAGAGVSAIPSVRRLPTPTVSAKAKEIPQAAITAKAFGLDPQSTLGWAVDMLGEIVRIPGTTIRAEDEFFKVIAKRAVQWREAYRKAMLSGEGLEGIKTRIIEYMNEMDPRVNALADEFSDYVTFTSDLGEYATHAGLVFSHPVLRVIVPFFRTPVNIFKAELDSWPGLHVLATQTRQELQSPSKAVQDVARARLALGSLTAAAFAYYAWNNLITGSGPLDPNLRREWLDAGNIPYAVKVGDTWVSYDRLTPIGMHLGLVADFVQLLREWSLDDEEPLVHELDELGGAIVLSIARNVTSRSWLMGVSDFLRTLTASKPQEWDRTFITNLLASPVPPAARQIERMIDPTEREVRTWIDNLVSRVPGLSDTLPPRLNLKGEPVQFGTGHWWEAIIPMRIAKDKNDPVRREILENKVSIELPGRTIVGPPVPAFGPEEQAKHGIELTPEQYYWYTRLAGNDLKLPIEHVRATLTSFGVPEFSTRKKALGAWDTLEELIQSPVYKAQTPEMKGMLIKAVIYGFRNAARSVLLQNKTEREQSGVIVPSSLPEFPDLANKYVMKFVERAGALGGPEAQQRALDEAARLKPGLFNLGR